MTQALEQKLAVVHVLGRDGVCVYVHANDPAVGTFYSSYFHLLLYKQWSSHSGFYRLQIYEYFFSVQKLSLDIGIRGCLNSVQYG